jgi:hypothetical protein
MAHGAEEHAPRFLALRHVLHFLFVRYDGLAQFGALVFDEEDMDEAVADEAAHRVKRPERPEDLKNDGNRYREAEQGYHEVSLAHGVLTGKGFHERVDRHQNACDEQRIEQDFTQEPCDIIALRVEKEKTAVEKIRGH